ncbi:MAG TPA: hypothetical protein VE733_16305 [Streptosporangiaceae bacterium]|nr:hypothetical protein [Streptosporangiaceae bacterium]
MTHESVTAETGPAGRDGAVSRSQQRWLHERGYLNGHRHALTAVVQDLYPASWRVAGTPLMCRPEWLPAAPVSLDAVTLSWDPAPRGTVIDGTRPVGSAGVRPLRDDGVRYGSYAAALEALSRPRLLENRLCYRLLEVRASEGSGRLAFGPGRYFDLINTSEAVAHETAGRVLARRNPGGGSQWPGQVPGQLPAGPLTVSELPLRSAVDDPLDLARRPVMTGVATLMLRLDQGAGSAQMFLHWRDPARVAVNGGLYQVAPAGMFQPSRDGEWNLANDLSLWRAIVRELSEELLGTSEDYGSDVAPIDYGQWPFFAVLDSARQAGTLRAYWLGAGVDPLTLDADLMTVLVLDAPFFDETFGGLVRSNDEGHFVTGLGAAGGDAGIEFTAATVERFTTAEAMQPAGAALLRLAWQHRKLLLNM